MSIWWFPGVLGVMARSSGGVSVTLAYVEPTPESRRASTRVRAGAPGLYFRRILRAHDLVPPSWSRRRHRRASVRTRRLDLAALAREDVDVVWAIWREPAVRRYLFDDVPVTR